MQFSIGTEHYDIFIADSKITLNLITPWNIEIAWPSLNCPGVFYVCLEENVKLCNKIGISKSPIVLLSVLQPIPVCNRERFQMK